MDQLEKMTLEILLRAGDARALAHEALDQAEADDFGKAERLLQESQDQWDAAHQLHSELLHLAPPLSPLLAHAMDQLMSVQTELGLIRRMIRQSRTIQELAARLAKLEQRGETT
jgi:PTS system cellobiose-specific IIA component